MTLLHILDKTMKRCEVVYFIWYIEANHAKYYPRLIYVYEYMLKICS